MSIRGKLTLVTLSAFIALYSIVGGMLSKSNNPLFRAIANPGPYPQLRIFEDVVRHIIQDYVEKPDLEKVRVGALRGLTDGLDPYSAYLLPPQVKKYQSNKVVPDTTGMVVGQNSGFAYVIAVIPGSPAEKATIKVGDVIEYIDGHATRDLDLYDVKSLLSGDPGSSVELTLFFRKPEKIKLVRGKVPATPTETRILESQVGYIKVPILSKGQSEAVASAVKEVIRKGAKSIILDLRGSAGGELKEVPVVVIIDRTTAGASEVVAAAIMENQRGEVVGERTLFGMGSEQELFPLDDGSALLLTVARHAAPSGKIFMTDGVTPTVEVKSADLADVGSSEEGKKGEAQTDGAPPVVVAPKPTDDQKLKKAIEVLTSGAKAKRRAV
jgi:carboxyl-terminal processing protease